MQNWLWDEKFNCSGEELSCVLKKECGIFTKTMLEAVKHSPNNKSKDLITEECLERFKGIAGVLADFLKDGKSDEDDSVHQNIGHNEDCGHYQNGESAYGHQDAKVLSAWILLGSLTESTLQMFLAFYIGDYENSKWQQWEDFEADKVKKPIIDAIQQLADEEKIDFEQSRKLKGAVKEEIKEHTEEHPVEKVMLDELIQFFTKQELLDEDELKNLATIQSYRNGIHSFQGRTIGTWDELQYSVRFFCYLMEWVMNCLPDVPDEEY